MIITKSFKEVRSVRCHFFQYQVWIVLLTKTGILMQIQREQSRRIGMMIICYFHISIGFSYGEYLQSLPWLKYCTHK